MTSLQISVPGRRKARRKAPYSWPSYPVFTFYNSKWNVCFQEKDADLDLFDTVMLWWPKATRTVRIGIQSNGKRWKYWTEANIRRVEDLIRYDLEHDGCVIKIQRESSSTRRLCSKEFRWKLSIRE